MRAYFCLCAAITFTMMGCSPTTGYVSAEPPIESQAEVDPTTESIHVTIEEGTFESGDGGTEQMAHSYSGYTECGDFFADSGERNTCQPGTYCADATFSKCALGCLSDQNCSPEQICVKNSGASRGTCQVY